MILTIDPGKRQCGWAIFLHDRLYACGLWRDEIRSSQAVTRTIVEIPQVYTRTKSKGDPNDLIDIAVKGGWLAGKMAPYATLEMIRPQQWKGTVDPEVMLDRIYNRLTDVEQALLSAAPCPASLRHNIVDAIGIGLHAVGRL